MSVTTEKSSNIKAKRENIDYLSSSIDFYLKIMATFVVGALILFLVIVFVRLQSANEIAITPFHSPQDLTQKGLDGDVLAAHFLAELVEVEHLARNTGSETYLPRANQDRIELSVPGDGVSNIKVEIPHTGISLGSVDAMMRWIGKETNIDGEVFESPSGPILVVRYGGHQSKPYFAPRVSNGELPQDAAWEIYAQFQPALYANYCLQKCIDSPWLVQSLEAVTQSGKRRSAAWAYWRLALLGNARQWGIRKGLDYLDESVAADPDFALSYDDRSFEKSLAGDSEGAFEDLELAIDRLASHSQDLKKNVQQVRLLADRITLAEYQGDFGRALALDRADVTDDYDGYKAGVPATEAMHQARLHNVSAARHLLADRAKSKDYGDLIAQAWTALAAEDWSGAESVLAQANASARNEGGAEAYQTLVEAEPMHAYSLAKLGRALEAAQLIGRASHACDFCRIEAGRIAVEKGDWSTAEKEYAAAAKLSPKLPFAYSAWGAMLLDKGDIPGAEEKLRSARRLGPHFADSEEALAEVFLRSAQYQRAIDAAQEAAREAPAWSRPHLTLSKALTGLRQSKPARIEYISALKMNPTPSDLTFFNR